MGLHPSLGETRERVRFPSYTNEQGTYLNFIWGSTELLEIFHDEHSQEYMELQKIEISDANISCFFQFKKRCFNDRTKYQKLNFTRWSIIAFALQLVRNVEIGLLDNTSIFQSPGLS